MTQIPGEGEGFSAEDLRALDRTCNGDSDPFQALSPAPADIIDVGHIVQDHEFSLSPALHLYKVSLALKRFIQRHARPIFYGALCTSAVIVMTNESIDLLGDAKRDKTAAQIDGEADSVYREKLSTASMRGLYEMEYSRGFQAHIPRQYPGNGILGLLVGDDENALVDRGDDCLRGTDYDLYRGAILDLDEGRAVRITPASPDLQPLRFGYAMVTLGDVVVGHLVPLDSNTTDQLGINGCDGYTDNLNIASPVPVGT